MEARANAKYKEILADYTPPEMDAGVQKDLDTYIERIRKG